MDRRWSLTIGLASALVASVAPGPLFAAPPAAAPAGGAQANSANAVSIPDDSQKLAQIARQLAVSGPGPIAPGASRATATAPAAAPGAPGGMPTPAPHAPAPSSASGGGADSAVQALLNTSAAEAPGQSAAPAKAPALLATTAAADARDRLPLGASPRTGSGATPATPGESWSWGITTLGALALVIGLIFALRGALAKITGRSVTPAGQSAAEVLSRISLGPRSQMVLVRMGRRILVLGETANGLSTLANIDDAEEVAGLLALISAGRPDSASVAFNQLLSRFDGQYGEEAEPTPERRYTQRVRVDQAHDQVSALVKRLKNYSEREAVR